MLGKVKIDSLKLRIPLHKVTYVDSTFAQKYKKIYVDTGEIGAKKNPKTGYFEEEINLDKHKVDITDGIKTRIAVANLRNGLVSNEYIVLQCNAKMLKNRYLEGISIETLPLLYQYIIDLKIVDFSYESFRTAYYSDIDFCYDVTVDPQTMIETNREIHSHVKPSCLKYVSKPFGRKDNVGINFNSRDKATPSRPHVKIYHKTLELQHNSYDFAQKHLKDKDYNNIGRLEYTIKNSKHRDYLNLKAKTLDKLLKTKPSVIEKIVFSGIFNYIDKNSINRDPKTHTASQRLLLSLINRCREHGDADSIFFEMLNQFKGTEKTRMKKLMLKVISNAYQETNVLRKLKNIQFLKDLKLDLYKSNPEQ